MNNYRNHNKNGNGNNRSRLGAVPYVRCAIYCRKSTSEGLDSDFNSLDAQREACQAYILSQRGEGWSVLPDRYEDGGYSGSNLDRPALKRLLLDVEAGKVDCVVVYKLDRLSRSLIDFTKLIDMLEKKRVSFVSVTQQFNSSTSMGRLTLNILLSFAQFEREIIAERTRDKMCAARRKGKWTGGLPVLGYDIDPQGGRLIVNQAEAERVRAIFKLYLEHQTLLSVTQELNARGWRTKSWIKRDGTRRPGGTFTKTNLHSLLNNVTYLGKVEHQGNIYKGEQGAIIDHTLWTQVQQLLKHNGRPGGHLHRNKYGALLKGLVYCGHCQLAMLHTYTKKGEKQYRYYTCSGAQKQGYSNCPSKSVPAGEFERFVVERIKEIGRDRNVFETTLQKVQAELEAKQEPLTKEKVYLQKEQADYQKQIKNILSAMGEGEQSSQLLTEHLGEIEDKQKRCQARLSEINHELLLIEKPSINKQELRQALSLFDPVWEVLFPKEQARILQLLIERLEYHGAKGTLSITFRPIGIQALAAEVKAANRERKRNVSGN